MARRHRSYSLEFKRQVAQQSMSGEIPLARSARQHDVSRNLIRIWVAKYEAGEFDDEHVQGDLLVRYEARIAELERGLQVAMQVDAIQLCRFDWRRRSGEGSLLRPLVLLYSGEPTLRGGFQIVNGRESACGRGRRRLVR